MTTRNQGRGVKNHPECGPTPSKSSREKLFAIELVIEPSELLERSIGGQSLKLGFLKTSTNQTTLKWIVSTIRTCHRIEDTRFNQQPLISMAGTPKNKLNKIRMEMMKRDNKEVAQDGVESTASLNYMGEGWLAKWTKQRGHATNELRE